MPLPSTQELFFKLLRAPTGIDEGLAQAGLSHANLEQIISSDEKASAAERMAIYANMYFFRILEILQKAFPLLLHYGGEHQFHNWITEYLWLRPSVHPSVARVGEALVDFLRHKLAGTNQAWLTDIAQLEWARSEVFDETDQTNLSLAVLQSLVPEQFSTLPLRAIAASRIVKFDYAVDEFWYSSQSETPLAIPEEVHQQPAVFWVWRGNGQIFHRAMESAEADFLAARPLQNADVTFGQLCDWLVEKYGEEAAVQKAFTLLSQWIHDGLIVEPKL